MSSKILCVDDSPTIRGLIKNSLSSKGYIIEESGDGAAALEQLTPDIELFIVDINMPVMNGFEFVENLKKVNEYKDKPVIFLTTESSNEKKARGKELGVSGWIVKPFERDTLLKIVDMLVG